MASQFWRGNWKKHLKKDDCLNRMDSKFPEKNTGECFERLQRIQCAAELGSASLKSKDQRCLNS